VEHYNTIDEIDRFNETLASLVAAQTAGSVLARGDDSPKPPRDLHPSGI
jgi:hypothetical protein